MGRGLRDLPTFRFIDLSVPISPDTSEPQPPRIEYVDHRHAAQELAAVATTLIRQATNAAVETPGIEASAFRDGLGLANENLRLDSHAGTHMDAPWHFGPLCEEKPARTI